MKVLNIAIAVAEAVFHLRIRAVVDGTPHKPLAGIQLAMWIG